MLSVRKLSFKIIMHYVFNWKIIIGIVAVLVVMLLLFSGVMMYDPKGFVYSIVFALAGVGGLVYAIYLCILDLLFIKFGEVLDAKIIGASIKAVQKSQRKIDLVETALQDVLYERENNNPPQRYEKNIIYEYIVDGVTYRKAISFKEYQNKEKCLVLHVIFKFSKLVKEMDGIAIKYLKDNNYI